MQATTRQQCQDDRRGVSERAPDGTTVSRAPSQQRRCDKPEQEDEERIAEIGVELGECGMEAADEPAASMPQEDSTFDDDLLEMEAFVSQIPAADGDDVAAAPKLPKLPPSRSRKRKKTPAQTAAKTSSTDGASAELATAPAPAPTPRTVTPGIIKSTRGKRTPSEVWAKLSDKEKARRESNRRSAQLAKKKKAEEIKELEESNALKRARIAELDKLLPALTEEARRATAEIPEQVLDLDAQAAVAAAVGADPVLQELFG